MISTPQFEIVIATHNPGKIREIQQALRSLPVKLRYLNHFPDIPVVNEVGQTYAENAALKAIGYAKETGLCTLADDSGLEVEALGGRPGQLSAHFGGEHSSDLDRIEKLLAAISQSGNPERTARFVCCMALAGWRARRKQARGQPRLLTITEAICEGEIAPAASGVKGFGFDPLFVPAGYNATFGELPMEVKRRISHRAKALAAIRVFLDSWLAQT